MSHSQPTIRGGRVVLRDHHGRTSSHVTASCRSGNGLEIHGEDWGGDAEIFGRDEYEYWVTIADEHLDALLVALLVAQSTTTGQLVTDVRAIAERHGIISKCTEQTVRVPVTAG